MWLRLRQIAGVAEKLAPVESDLMEVLGVQVCYRDPGIDFFGLENALFPIGDQLLEVVAPIRENTAGGRYLARRGGDSGYMVITQCDDHPPRRQRVVSASTSWVSASCMTTPAVSLSICSCTREIPAGLFLKLTSNWVMARLIVTDPGTPPVRTGNGRKSCTG